MRHFIEFSRTQREGIIYNFGGRKKSALEISDQFLGLRCARTS